MEDRQQDGRVEGIAITIGARGLTEDPMAFAGLNYLAVVIAAIAGWLVGALWYGVLAKPWIAALGTTLEEFKSRQVALKGSVKALPFVLAFVADLIMAWMLAGVLGHLGPGQVTLRNGIISGAFLWFGFVLTTMAVNNAFSGRKYRLTAIDAGHWLAVLVVMGAIVGGAGIR
jgi:Protein of unknown function (DUF1761)